MQLIFQLLFWLSIFAIFHSYVLYPLILNILSKGEKQNQIIYLSSDENLPKISIVMAAHNEEEVIAQKIESIYNTNYPIEKIEVLIGSDASTDKTDEIIKEKQKKYSSLFLTTFKRQGKANIINQLTTQSAKGEIIILTDANVFFDKNTIYHLSKHYKNSEIALVGGNILNPGHDKNGISLQEKSYLTKENQMKYQEGILWGTMIGAFGGCYSIRKEFYAPVPKNFFMDDFYITMSVLAKKKKAINELDAVCYEDVSNIIKEEFRRKIRISLGNFQNLTVFSKLLLPLNKGLSFSFLSHKVLRWLVPFFIIISYFSCFFLRDLEIYSYIFYAYSLSFLFPAIDYFLRKINIHNILLRFITHFYGMNLALLLGFFKFLKGVNTNVWQPTQRNQ